MGNKVAFFDSGIGGIPYLVHLRNIRPEYNYIYLADNANFPYGVKNSEEIREIVLEAVGRLIVRTDPDIIVIACNTATVVTLPYLREKYPVPFVGVVPAVKPAAIISGNRRIGLFATNKTVSDSYTENLISQFADNCEVHRLADPGIVYFIENEFLDADEKRILEMLKPVADYFIEKNVDHVVLGCTHFLFIDKYLEKLFPDNIRTIDSRDGVSRQVIRIAAEKGLGKNRQENSSRFFLTSEKNNTDYYKKLAGKYSLEFSGII